MSVLEWFQSHEAVLWWLGWGSAATFFGTIIAVPMLVVRIPADYFVRDVRPASWVLGIHPALRLLLRLGKNMLGLLLFAVGVLLLFLPGQGLLTILVGVILLDFPGKYCLERRLAYRPGVLRVMNWMRTRAGVAPLQDFDTTASGERCRRGYPGGGSAK